MKNLVGVACAMLLVSGTNAQSITRTFDFTASHFFNFFDASLHAPVDPVIGSATISFDRSLLVEDKTTGIKLNNINIMLGSHIAYSYYPTYDELRFGGINVGVSGAAGSTDDFYIIFSGASTTPRWGSFFYYQVATGDDVFASWNGNVSIVARDASTLPEPSSWAFMVGGFGLVGGAKRSRRKTILSFA